MKLPDHITDVLTRALRDYHQRVGELPVRIYLGHPEYWQLRRYAESFGVRQAEGDNAYPLTWNGIPVFEVVANHHLAFGWDGDSPCG